MDDIAICKEMLKTRILLLKSDSIEDKPKVNEFNPSNELCLSYSEELSDFDAGEDLLN